MNGKPYITDMELAPPGDCCTKWMNKFKKYNDAYIIASMAGLSEEECLKKAIETTEADSDWQSCQSEWTRVMEENEGLKSRILLLEHELAEKGNAREKLNVL